MGRPELGVLVSWGDLKDHGSQGMTEGTLGLIGQVEPPGWRFVSVKAWVSSPPIGPVKLGEGTDIPLCCAGQESQDGAD